MKNMHVFCKFEIRFRILTNKHFGTLYFCFYHFFFRTLSSLVVKCTLAIIITIVLLGNKVDVYLISITIVIINNVIYFLLQILATAIYDKHIERIHNEYIFDSYDDISKILNM